MNATTSSTWRGHSPGNATAGLQEQSTTKTDHVWLFHLKGRNNSTSVNVDASSSDPRDRNKTSSVLYLTELSKEFNPPQSQVSSDTRTESDTVDKDMGEDTPSVDVIPQTVNQKTIAPAPVRDWRRTLQVMPRMEDFLSTWPKSKSVSIRDTVSRTSYSMIHEVNSQFDDSDSAVSNMDMQGNRRTSLGYRISTPVNQEHG